MENVSTMLAVRDQKVSARSSRQRSVRGQVVRGQVVQGSNASALPIEVVRGSHTSTPDVAETDV